LRRRDGFHKPGLTATRRAAVKKFGKLRVF
jgi:hypothetical protein